MERSVAKTAIGVQIKLHEDVGNKATGAVFRHGLPRDDISLTDLVPTVDRNWDTHAAGLNCAKRSAYD